MQHDQTPEMGEWCQSVNDDGRRCGLPAGHRQRPHTPLIPSSAPWFVPVPLPTSPPLPYDAVSVNGRAMEWKVPLWNAIVEWRAAQSLNDVTGVEAACAKVEGAVELAMALALQCSPSSASEGERCSVPTIDADGHMQPCLRELPCPDHPSPPSSASEGERCNGTDRIWRCQLQRGHAGTCESDVKAPAPPSSEVSEGELEKCYDCGKARGGVCAACHCPEIATLRAQLAERDAELRSEREACNDGFNLIWQLVYPGKTDWEYPGMVYRHVRDLLAEIRAGRDTAIDDLSRQLSEARAEVRSFNEACDATLDRLGSSLAEARARAGALERLIAHAYDLDVDEVRGWSVEEIAVTVPTKAEESDALYGVLADLTDPAKEE